MKKEIPAKIWVPLLTAWTLILAAILFGNPRRLLSESAVLGTLGLAGYLAVCLSRRVKTDRSFKDKFLSVTYGFGAFMALMIAAGISGANRPPPTASELAAQQAAQQAEARRDYLFKKDHLSDAECLELYGPDADKPHADGSYGLCQRVDVNEVMRKIDAYDRNNRELIEMKKADEARRYFGVK